MKNKKDERLNAYVRIFRPSFQTNMHLFLQMARVNFQVRIDNATFLTRDLEVVVVILLCSSSIRSISHEALCKKGLRGVILIDLSTTPLHASSLFGRASCLRGTKPASADAMFVASSSSSSPSEEARIKYLLCKQSKWQLDFEARTHLQANSRIKF